ncbi:hypothetical protein [Photobacterium sp. BZF1]|uniref:hypothetical protein n=1 Tax=Photobacterium sp. BZF1 TaxID=1904457 RepID=UPI0021068FB9|nr:hypothetical protein [Photobacterium sp. BZF1]
MTNEMNALAATIWKIGMPVELTSLTQAAMSAKPSAESSMNLSPTGSWPRKEFFRKEGTRALCIGEIETSAVMQPKKAANDNGNRCRKFA